MSESAELRPTAAWLPSQRQGYLLVFCLSVLLTAIPFWLG
jgi:heme/copper-type cytochrome/quinol oxidase subunit 4